MVYPLMFIQLVCHFNKMHLARISALFKVFPKQS